MTLKIADWLFPYKIRSWEHHIKFDPMAAEVVVDGKFTSLQLRDIADTLDQLNFRRKPTGHCNEKE